MKLTIKKLEEMILEELDEATNQQKTQQRKANWDLRDKHRKLAKKNAKKVQIKKDNEDEEDVDESPFPREKSDFDPIKDLGKAMKKRHKDLEVYANGEEVKD